MLGEIHFDNHSIGLHLLDHKYIAAIFNFYPFRPSDLSLIRNGMTRCSAVGSAHGSGP